MFFSQEDIPDMEKINRIYKMLRAERRARLIGLFIRLFIFGGLIYGFYYLSLPENVATRDKLITTVQGKISELIMPMVGTMVQDLTKNMLDPSQFSDSPTSPNKKNIPTTGLLPSNITPEMIQAVQNAMKK